MANGQNYVIYSGTNITDVERVNQQKINYLLSSNLTAPTTQFPAYILSGASSNQQPGPNSNIGNTITVYPMTIRQKGAIQVQYVRYPVTPNWTYVTLTGGEPLLQVDDSLITALKKANIYIAIETNGTLKAPKGIDWICMSPKANTDIQLTVATLGLRLGQSLQFLVQVFQHHLVHVQILRPRHHLLL